MHSPNLTKEQLSYVENTGLYETAIEDDLYASNDKTADTLDKQLFCIYRRRCAAGSY